jgi:hypothetical protein
VPVRFASWRTVAKLVEETAGGSHSHAEKRLLRELHRYLKDVMSIPSDPTCRDLLSSSAERVRAGCSTVELEEAPSDDRNGT